MFNPDQVTVAISEAQSIPVLLGKHMEQEGKNMKIFLMALANYIEKTSPLSKDEVFEKILLKDLQSTSDLSAQLQLLLVHMVEVGVENGLVTKIYTTGDVARFFGVTVATVNNWLSLKRLTGVEKEARYKQARIPETATYTAVTGDVMTIKEAAEIYEANKKRTTVLSLTPSQELQELLHEIIFFEKKYGGEFKNTLAQKIEKLTPAEQRDANEWKHLLKEVEDYRV